MGADTESGSRTGEQIATFDLGAVRRFADVAVRGLSEAREEIDALNVYPVPDGDTGTNLFLTLESARNALRDAVGGEADTSPPPAAVRAAAGAEAGPRPAPADVRTALAAFPRGALLGARGNSGVILSSLVG